MASPWKLVARLVSPRRQQRQEHDLTGDVTPDVLAIAADNGLNIADPPADEKRVTDDQLGAVSAARDHADETANGVPGKAHSEGARPVEMADTALSDDAGEDAGDARNPSRAGDGATRKRRKRGKTAARSEAVPPPFQDVPAVSDDAINLDEEIRLLRKQLARKLRLQNAQLKRMLERFER